MKFRVKSMFRILQRKKTAHHAICTLRFTSSIIQRSTLVLDSRQLSQIATNSFEKIYVLVENIHAFIRVQEIQHNNRCFNLSCELNHPLSISSAKTIIGTSIKEVIQTMRHSNQIMIIENRQNFPKFFLVIQLT